MAASAARVWPRRCPLPALRAGADDERRPAPARPGAARRLLSVPPTQSYDARAGNSAVVRGSSAAGRTASATAEPPAGPTAADASWETLYAIAQRADHAYAHYNLRYLLLGRGDSERANRHFALAAARQPDNLYIYYDWAWSLETSGEPAVAAALYRKAIEIDPDRRPGLDARRRLVALTGPR